MTRHFITNILLLSSLFLSSALFAQKAAKDNGKNPEWVTMMEDPNVNYYEAVKSFNEFWKGREMPIDEADVLNEEMTGREKREHRRAVRKLKKMSPAERQEFDYLAYQYKRFKNWEHEVFPYVQNDGSILTDEQRRAIWEQQQKEAQEKSKN